MSAFSSPQRSHTEGFRRVHPSRREGSVSFGPAALVLVGCLGLATVLTADHARTVWHTGAFYDTDDAMRAVQLRAWLDGQGWYDLSVARLNPPDGVFMHWSRVVDVPLAALALLAEPIFGTDLAERFARLAFPGVCLVALFAAAGWTARVVGGARAWSPAVVLCFLGAPFFGQFVPGRIDHHAPQIALLMTMTGALLASFEPKFARYAGVAGFCAALSLAISLENLPFIAIGTASIPLRLVCHGQAARTAMLWFAGAFASALICCFLATVGPGHRLAAACDALSVAHVAAGLVGCAALAALAVSAGHLKTTRARIGAVAVCAPLPLLALRYVAPHCLGEPFVGLDPLVRDMWLRHVAEVEPLPSFLRTNPWTAVSMLVPMLAGTIAAFAGAVRARGVARARYALVGAMLVMSLAMACWGIRVLSSGLPFVAVAVAPWLGVVASRWGTTPISRLGAAVLAALPASPLLLAMLLPSDGVAGEGGTLSCVTPDALSPLATLTPGTILAPIDMGSHLLAFTPHAVFAAPYHRDNAGNRLVFDALLAAPDTARDLVASSGADYVALCANAGQTKVVAARAPDGLAAQLLAGRTPAWLEPVALPSPQKIYRVKLSPPLRTGFGD